MIDIEEVIERKGLTKATIAARMGICRQNFSKMLKNPKLDTIERLADAIGVPAWQLLQTPENAPAQTDNYTAMFHYNGESYYSTSLEETRRWVNQWCENNASL